MGKVKSNLVYLLLIGVSSGLYVLITYFLERHESILLIGSYTILFLIFGALYKLTSDDKLNTLLIAGVVFRLLLLPAFPNLSDDIFRFVWDGKLIDAGIHPFAELPSTYMESGTLPEGITIELFNSLNSPDYFTIYPPLAQFIFWLSVVISPNSVQGSAIIIRILIILAEIGTLYYLKTLLNELGKPARHILLYALNPLVIIELTGNLHFEAFMIFFLLAVIYLIIKKEQVIWAAISMALAIVSKLLPIMFLPLFVKQLRFRKLVLFYLFTGLITLVIFLPLVDVELFRGMGSSLSLYFQKFEFNASIYYVVREIGFWVKGYNIIGTAGKYLALTSFIAILIISFLSKKDKTQIANIMMWILAVYFLFTTTLHPWYVTTIVALSVLTKYRFTVAWSFFIFLTYVGYVTDGFQENLIFTVVEYGVVILFMFYELYQYNFKTKVESGKTVEL